MDKDRKKTFKKTFVRNTEQGKPKTVVINEQAKKIPTEPKEHKKPDGKNKAVCPGTKFDTPNVNSALLIARKAETIENAKPRKVKSVSSLTDGQKLAIDEKITRKMNFAYDQPIYKGLIPLCTTKPEPPKVPSVHRYPVKTKDPEPKLSDFCTLKTLPEYTYHVTVESKPTALVKQCDNLKLYRTMQNWQ